MVADTPRKVDRSALGANLLGGAVVAFAIFFLQLHQDRQERRADDRQRELAELEHRRERALAERQGLILTLGLQRDLTGIDLSARGLGGMYLGKKTLSGARLTNANLRRTDLRDSDLQRAHLNGADLRGAFLVGADLRRAFLLSANLRGAELATADMRDAELNEADRRWADLSLADLRDASLSKTDFRGADLAGTDLRQSHYLDQARLRKAVADPETQWPEGFDPRAAGVLQE